MSEILIKIKQTSSNTTNEIKIPKEATVSELKTKIEELTSIKPELQNLVYKGRILANEKILNDYGLDNDHVIILVKKYVEEKKEEKSTEKKETTTSNNGNINTTSNIPSNQNQSQSNLNQDPFSMYGNMGFGGMGGMGGLGGNMDMNQLNELMSNPMYQQAMDQVLSNPQMVQRMLDNPQIKPLLDQNPHLRQMMSNPDFLRTMMNPQTLQGLSSMMGGQGQNQGQGQNNLGLNPLLFSGFPMGGSSNLGQSQNTENTGTTNTSNTNNTNPFNNLYSGMNFNPYQNINPREAYQEQNKKLKEMGFTNDDANYEALGKTGGNVDAAVERLLNMLG